MLVAVAVDLAQFGVEGVDLLAQALVAADQLLLLLRREGFGHFGVGGGEGGGGLSLCRRETGEEGSEGALGKAMYVV